MRHVMESGESGPRQGSVCSPKTKALVGICADRHDCSEIPTVDSTEDYHARSQERMETSYRERPTMPTTLISPSAPYHHYHHNQHQHHNSFSSGYLHSAPATSIPGIISPVEPRRLS